MVKVAVCSRSFSRHDQLRAELIEKFPDAYFNDMGKSLNGDELVDFLKDADRAVTALETIDETIISQLPNLKVIGKYGVGLDMIDFNALDRADVQVGWAAGVNRRSVSELVISMTISMLRFVPQSNAEVKSGTWRQHVGRQLSDQTIGIIGCGNVGKDLVQLLQPFGCKILVHDIVDYADFYTEYNIQAVSMDDLVRQSDIITLHVPKNSTTEGMFSRDYFEKMKDNSILINAARGGLVDELALKDHLTSGHLSGAAFDVLNQEPPTDMDLVNIPNFLVVPHIGGSAAEAILAMGRAAIDGLSNYKPAKEYLSY